MYTNLENSNESVKVNIPLLVVFATVGIVGSIVSAGVVDTSAGVVDTSVAVVDTGAAVVDTSAAVVETGVAVVDTSAAVVETGVAVVETGTEVGETVDVEDVRIADDVVKFDMTEVIGDATVVSV